MVFEPTWGSDTYISKMSSDITMKIRKECKISKILRICVSRFPRSSNHKNKSFGFGKLEFWNPTNRKLDPKFREKNLFYPNKTRERIYRGQLSSGIKWHIPRIFSGMNISGVGQIRLNKNIQTHSKLTLFVLFEFNLLKMPIYFRTILNARRFLVHFYSSFLAQRNR